MCKQAPRRHNCTTSGVSPINLEAERPLPELNTKIPSHKPEREPLWARRTPKRVPITVPLIEKRKQYIIAIFGKLLGTMGSFSGSQKLKFVPSQNISNRALLWAGREAGFRHLELLDWSLVIGAQVLTNSSLDRLSGNASLEPMITPYVPQSN